MTLNVWQGRLERVLLRHLETLDIDFACMQEAVDYSSRSGGLVSSFEKIGKSMQLDQQFFSPLTSMKLGNSDIKFGNVIYSKYPFSAADTIFTRGAYKDSFDFDKDDYNVRAFQHVKILINGKSLHLINYHGHHIEAHKLGDEETLRQVGQIMEYIRYLEGAIIVCGDFNLAPESQSIKMLSERLTNLSVSNSLQTTRSSLTYKKEVCDYIFVNDSVFVRNFIMDGTIISDHNALLLEFDLK